MWRCYILVLLASTAAATTYYVDPQGSDLNVGTAPAAPWATLAPVNSHHYSAGDTILFRGGATFSGRLLLGTASSGSASNPITISSYGSGRATISAGATEGIYLFNTAGVTIDSIDVVGAGAPTNTKNGVMVYNNLSGNVTLSGVTIKNVDVSGFGDCGIQLGGGSGTSGFDSVTISNVVAHDNSTAGISSFAPTGQHYAFSNVLISDCVVRNNLGDPATTSPTGSGIVLRSANHATIQFCESYNNGGANPSKNNGGVGIWTTESTNVIFQFNESHHNHTQGVDGDGFDFDGGTTNSIMQYNYSHDNDGAGFLLCTFTGSSAHSGNTVRYNISENDARTTGYGAFQIYQNPVGDEIYNNTVFMPAATRAPAAVRFASYVGSNLHFRNNIFIATGGVVLLDVSGGTATLFQGNDYWTAGGAFSVKYNGVIYNSLAAWQATSQEMLNGIRVGLQVDPLLANAGGAGTVGDPHQLSTLASYKLQAASSLVTAGLPLSSDFGISVGTQDFFGNTINGAVPTSVGADQGTPPAPAPPPTGTTPAPVNTKLVNISTRSLVGTGVNVQIAGFIISGSQPKTVLIRASGPALAQFNVTGLLDDPVLTLFSGQTQIYQNDDWGSDNASASAIQALTNSMRLFNLGAGSKDAALVVTLPPGGYTAQVSGKSNASGVCLIEVYEADSTPVDSRLTNISTRSLVGTDANIQIAGFVINGAQPKTVLIRASGPALAQFGMSGLLNDPVLTLFSGSTQIDLNDDWSSDSTTATPIETLGSSMHLFSLARGSKDAALLKTLPSGGYTAQVSGKNGSTGIVLIEVYEVP